MITFHMAPLKRFFFPFSLQGSLRSSHQISPQEFLGELKSGVMDERLFACLDSLRVSLTSNPVRYSTDFFFSRNIVFWPNFPTVPVVKKRYCCHWKKLFWFGLFVNFSFQWLAFVFFVKYPQFFKTVLQHTVHKKN